jgi:hypothetical protein
VGVVLLITSALLGMVGYELMPDVQAGTCLAKGFISEYSNHPRTCTPLRS